MFFVLALLAAGGTYVAVDMLASGLLMALAFAVVIMPIIIAAEWVNEKSGTGGFITHSWQFLSGSRTPGGVVVECANYGSSSGWHFLFTFIVLILALANVIIGLTAWIAVPGGVLASFVGGLGSLVTKTTNGIRIGSATLGIGLSALIISGLMFRLMHFLSSYGCV